MATIPCSFCHGVGTVQAGNTTIKDKKTGAVKTVSGIQSSGCQSCGGSGIMRAFNPA